MPNFLDSLNEEQKQVVINNSTPALVLAGPGSGKTRALTHKIAYMIRELHVHPDNILAVTFTNKAAKEMKERVSALLKEIPADTNTPSDYSEEKAVLGDSYVRVPSWIGTFHSICARILRIDGHYLEIDRNFVIYDTDESLSLIKSVLSDLGIPPKNFSPTAIMSAISKAKCEMVTPAQFKAQVEGGYFFETVAQIYPLYQKKLRDNNALDFNDLLSDVVKLFNTTPEVLDKYQNMFQYILVDEYQDTNRVQYYLIKLLAQKHRNLTVVGDISQSIYSWRGADYRNMTQFQEDYPDALTLQLATNYRSTANILNAAKTLIQNNSTHISIDLHTNNPEGEKIILFEGEHEKIEAAYIARIISNAAGKNTEYEDYDYQGESYSSYAILYRTNAQSRALEESLLAYGIPYRIVGGLRFYDRKEIKDVLSYLKVFYNPKDSVSWMRCINNPPRKVGPKTFSKIEAAGFDIEMINELTKLDWSRCISMAQDESARPIELLDEVLKTFGYLEYLNDGTEESLARIENLKELRSVAKQYESLGQFLENIALIESSNRADQSDSDAVIMMTLHAAKGLEFDNVFLVGLEEGILPHSRAMTDPGELEEERRLCYVGITRARKSLYMTYTRHRSFYGGTGSSLVSRFISEIPEDLLEFRYG